MHAVLSYGFEALLILMLIATLYYAMRLESRLGVLKRDRAELEHLVSGFNEATLRAESSIQKLRQAAEGAGRELATRQDAAETLRNDLQFLLDRGERIADRLDDLVRASRPLVPSVTEQRAKHPSHPEPERPRTPAEPSRPLRAPEPEPDEPRVRSQAERDLLRALRLAR